MSLFTLLVGMFAAELLCRTVLRLPNSMCTFFQLRPFCIGHFKFNIGILLLINPYLTNEFYHHYQLDESTFIFNGVRSDF